MLKYRETNRQYAPCFNLRIRTRTDGGRMNFGWPDEEYFAETVAKCQTEGILLEDIDQQWPPRLAVEARFRAAAAAQQQPQPALGAAGGAAAAGSSGPSSGSPAPLVPKPFYNGVAADKLPDLSSFRFDPTYNREVHKNFTESGSLKEAALLNAQAPDLDTLAIKIPLPLGEDCFCLSKVDENDPTATSGLQLKKCGHCFHRGCLKEWFDHGDLKCPKCLAELGRKIGPMPNGVMKWKVVGDKVPGDGGAVGFFLGGTAGEYSRKHRS